MLATHNWYDQLIYLSFNAPPTLFKLNENHKTLIITSIVWVSIFLILPKLISMQNLFRSWVKKGYTLYQVVIAVCVTTGDVISAGDHCHGKKLCGEIQNFRAVPRTRGQGKSFNGDFCFEDICAGGEFPSLWEHFPNFLLHLWDREWKDISPVVYSQQKRNVTTYIRGGRSHIINALKLWRAVSYYLAALLQWDCSHE